MPPWNRQATFSKNIIMEWVIGQPCRAILYDTSETLAPTSACNAVCGSFWFLIWNSRFPAGLENGEVLHGNCRKLFWILRLDQQFTTSHCSPMRTMMTLPVGSRPRWVERFSRVLCLSYNNSLFENTSYATHHMVNCNIICNTTYAKHTSYATHHMQ